ncbi:MAG: DegT/DnrJ/EryC1/StrS family aminotransferase [Candidatus Delongbacteria bacterium]|nr:DegT/DnrJ/EryC1/StrS family aminotransferase [Candidatus Delongbacteria bacterium]MCG2760017.1 DegT/DnrJ/EryC1/StrS family aminotransferase [Candidatus Delongbacteria bacterium]
MNIQMVDMRKQYDEIRSRLEPKVLEVLSSGYYVGGPELKAFEEKAASYIGVKHAIGCANGTDALQISMMAIGIEPGDEIITTPFTFIATAETIRILGAKSVFVDIEADTYNIDPAKIEAAITKKTKAIIPVHLYGQAADMDKINAIAKKHNLIVIEDNAQGFGAKYKNKMLGSLSDIATVSFYPAKNLGAAGDGGLMLTDCDDLAIKVRMIANHGQNERYKHQVVGVNSRLDAIQAVILNIKLDYLDGWNKKRRDAASRYKANLKNIAVIPFEHTDNYHIYHQFSIQVVGRDELQKFLTENKIPSAVHYPIPLHLQHAFKDLGQGIGSFPISEKVADGIISLPMHPHLAHDEIDFISNKINEFYK